MYADINKHTGLNTNMFEYLAQVIADSLSTPTATRLIRRLYGSSVPELVDAPNNTDAHVRLYAAVATSLIKDVPILQLTRVQLALGEDPAKPESVIFYIDGYALLAGKVYPLNNFKVKQ